MEYKYEIATIPKKRKKKFGLLKKILWIHLVSILFGSGAAVAFYAVSDFLNMEENSTYASEMNAEATIQEIKTDKEAIAVIPETEQRAEETGNISLNVSNIAQEALPCIVSITNISVQEVENYFDRFGRYGRGSMRMEETTSCGSGILIEADEEKLYMVTNYHVVEEARTISVSFVDNATCEASLCGIDTKRDLAVIAVALEDVSNDTLNQISVIDIGSSSELIVGEQVVAIGNALGYGQSVTTGIVSALNRSIGDDSEEELQTYIQTDAAINPGNSGGALLDMEGKLIGINTAKLSSTEIEGMGYAIPITEVWDVITELMQQKTELQSQNVSSDNPFPVGNGLENGNSPMDNIPGKQFPQGARKP